MTPEKYKFLIDRINKSFYYIRVDNLCHAKKIFKQLSKNHNTIINNIDIDYIELVYNKMCNSFGFCFQIYHVVNYINDIRYFEKCLKVHTFLKNEMNESDKYFINYPKDIKFYCDNHNLSPTYYPKKIKRTLD